MPTVVRRGPGAEKKRLPPELEALASGEEKRFRPSRPKTPRLRDPRAVALVPGVANRDARALCDARVEEVEALLARRAEGTEAENALAVALAEAVVLEVWRGRSLTGFEAFAENVLGLQLDDARALVQRGLLSLGLSADPRSDELIAVWMRAEIALREIDIAGRVGCRIVDGQERIVIELPAGRAPEQIQAIGRKMAPLARDQAEPR